MRRKLAGILAEAATTAEGRLDRVVLGIGVNVDQAGFPLELADRAVSLRMLTGRRARPGAAAGPAARRA